MLFLTYVVAIDLVLSIFNDLPKGKGEFLTHLYPNISLF